MKDFLGTCVDNPFGTKNKLALVMKNKRRISKSEFFREVEPEYDLRQAIKEYPHDFTFFKSGTIYFYVYSAIEHFYG